MIMYYYYVPIINFPLIYTIAVDVTTNDVDSGTEIIEYIKGILNAD